MGLDMYLTGRKMLYRNEATSRKEDGYLIEEIKMRLAYWRKHPNLHGFIVQEFADGVDECQPIELEVEQLQKCIEAVEQGKLPHTDGFFFGSSDWWATPERVEETTRMLMGAISWLQRCPEGEYREVVYQASW